MEKYFKLKENGTDVRTEVIAGVTTFLSMVYILAVNPNILSAAGMDSAAVFTATAVSAFFGTLFMAFFANYPVALASGMGLNAYFAFSVCIPMAKAGINDPWKIALTAVLVEGIIFVLLSLTNFREKLVNDVPSNLKYGITAGIGLFITIVGLKGAGVVIGSESTLVDLGSVSTPQFVLAMVGFVIICVLVHYNVPGAVLWGILLTWIMGIIAQLTGWYHVDPAKEVYSLIPSLSGASFIPKAPTMFAFDFGWVAKNIVEFAVIVFSFLFVDLFDTLGTLIGVASKADMLDEDGKLPHIKGALMADSIATCAGAVLGTSTTTTFVESASGVTEGGRTGLTSMTTGVLFLLAVVFSPLFLTIPSFATAPALIIVGFYMMGSALKIEFDDPAEGIPAFLTILAMPTAYSISEGIAIGVISWTLLNLITGKAKEKKISPLMYILTVLFILKYVLL